MNQRPRSNSTTPLRRASTAPSGGPLSDNPVSFTKRQDFVASLNVLPQASSRRRSVLASVPLEDDYDYNDVGKSPEGSATKERGNQIRNINISDIRLDSYVSVGGGEAVLDKVGPSIYQRQAGTRRARLPDEEKGQSANNVALPAKTKGGAPDPSQHIRNRSSWLLVRKQAYPGLSARNATAQSKLRYVMLHRPKEDEEDSTKFTLLSSPNATDQSTQSHNHITWQHANCEYLGVEMLKGLVEGYKLQGLQASEVGLTQRLLERVRLVAEKKFIGGNFLKPLTLRYDMVDELGYSADESCLFLSFPYFALCTEEVHPVLSKSTEVHPKRTLLQSRYRLNDTREDDKFQSIRGLKKEAMKSCFDGDTGEGYQSQFHKLIYVPQMWALIMGVGKIITAGPISDPAFQGRSLTFKDSATQHGSKSCSFVRISFGNWGKSEELMYPIEQCSCWLALLNKRQQIREILSSECTKGTKGNRDTDGVHEYRFEYGGRVINARTWSRHQRECRDEVLELWMTTPKRRSRGVSLRIDGASESASDDDMEANASSHTEQDVDNHTARVPTVDCTPIVSGFLEWALLDEFDNPDPRPMPEKLSRFLDYVYGSLPAPRKFSIRGKTVVDIENFVKDTSLSHNHESSPTIALYLLEECKVLLSMFLPREHDVTLAAIQMFWGSLFEILHHHGYVEGFLKKLKRVSFTAYQIHVGVYCQVVDNDGDPKDRIANCAILLSSMVRALRLLFLMLIAAVDEVRSPQFQDQPSGSGDKVEKRCSEACRMLQRARDELISEASGSGREVNIGPVITPEALLIMFMERLGRGVHDKNDFDVINVFEQCLEHLALEVKNRASRRILQMINRLDEEVSIVKDVLHQQQQVLVDFRHYLNPLTFKRPSIARKLRFEYEDRSIAKLLRSIEEQLQSCTELRDRAKVLAIQNVQLVETSQDDNDRAILIFTFITVFFVPLTFVSGFFGMNVDGISSKTFSTADYWKAALPLTGGLMIISGAVIFGGEWLKFVSKLIRRMQ